MEGEPDATSLMQLKELKALYRQRYGVLRDIKAEVNYCQHLVDQCRLRLLSEFENWYTKSFLVPEEEEEELDITMDKMLKQREDNQLQYELPPDCSSSESFYNARNRVLKRRNSRALSSTQVQRTLSAASGQRRLLPVLPVR